jgi:CHAD domain-containing protein
VSDTYSKQSFSPRMSMEFKGKKSATKETRKILRREIDKGLACLDGRRISDGRIHRARKQIKMARATLRLLRDGLSNKHYRSENRRLRDAAKPLSEARDAAVLRKAFEHIRTRAPRTDVRTDGALEMERMLASEQSKAHRQVSGGRGVPHARRLLHEARAWTFRWQLSSGGWSTIGEGLRLIYRQGRKALRAVHSAPSDAAFHEWRKQVKYLRYQIQLLRPIWPGPLEALAAELHSLSDYLGDDHDLVVLRAKLTSNESPLPNEPPRAALLATLDRERATLQRKALQLGAGIFEERPALFCSRLRQYWRDWRHSPK